MDIRTLYEKTNADMDEEVVISVIEKAERGELMYSERMDQFFSRNSFWFNRRNAS